MSRPETNGRLVVVSNRVPQLIKPRTKEEERKLPVGGLVSVLRAAMEGEGGLWLGWSGKVRRQRAESGTHELKVSSLGAVDIATIDLNEDDYNLYYTGFCNRTLWPLLHSFPSRVQIREEEYRAYRRVNRRLARLLAPRLDVGDRVWIHDYHLLPLAQELRHLGWDGRIGFFLHTPFPSHDVFSILPWVRELSEAITACDLVGFHTHRYSMNFADTLVSELGGTFDGSVYRLNGLHVRLGAYPIGTDPERWEEWASTPQAKGYGGKLRRAVNGRRIVLAVDRLDYSKGIPERLRAFERLLDRYPSWRSRVTMVQVTVPSRTRVPAYLDLKQDVEQTLAGINGRFSEEDWLPIVHLYRSYRPQQLAAMYREADVCLITPLRDGMNLVAKEFIASQVGEPGVLMLSRFCGAAEDLRESVIINPYDVDGTALDLKRSLEMPLAERQRRWAALAKRVQVRNASAWRERFLDDMSGGWAHLEKDEARGTEGAKRVQENARSIPHRG